MDYKNTLNMPKTEFEMKGNLNKKDSKFILEWKNKEIYKYLSERNGDKFILHDGPPYANGDIHIGHSMNKILKDIIIREKALSGKKIDWRLGWDTHGLPIELKVQQSGIKLSDVGREKYIEECEKYAKEQVLKQEKQFEKLGILTDFKKKYLTLEKEFEARQINVFNKMLNKNLIYQDLKPVYWSWSSETALAEAEIEYKNITDWSIYVSFYNKEINANLIIWTTTPWTLPGNVAIALGKKIEYSIVEIDGEKSIIANALIEKLKKQIKKDIKFVEKFDVSKIIGTYAINPLNDKKSKIVWGHHVNIDSGTGLVHISGGHGQDDYQIVKENNLDLFVVMDDKGHTINSDEFNGNFYLKTNKLIIEKLKINNKLIFLDKFIHSVPIDWRTKEPVVYRATKQWFVSINKIEDKLIEEIKKVKWYPSWGEERLTNMMKNRSDWCISRQRVWGVPIPIIYDEKNIPIIDNELQNNIVSLINEKGSIGWYKSDIKEILPKKIKYNEKMRKEEDILDVWFDSGTSHELFNKEIADICLEGNDQYRGWFNSSIITSFVSKEKSPYKKVITHGMTLDSKGNKMSKSLGNVIDPIEITNEYGLDILRMWVASSDYQDNVKISRESINQITSDYRKIRNTSRFILGSIYDFDEFNDNLSEFSKVILNEIKKSSDLIKIKYKKYNFLHALKEILNQLSTSGFVGYYLDYYKEFGYTFEKNSLERREGQYILSKILEYILYSISPILPVTSEEIWSYYSKENDLFFKNVYPKLSKIKSEYDFCEFIKIREIINKSIEKKREENIIKRSNEVEIKLNLPNDLIKWKKIICNKMLLVAKISVFEGELKSEALKFNGIKCERCWNYFDKKDITNNLCNKNCLVIIKNKI